MYVASRRQALTRTAYLLTGHHQDAEALVQLTLIKVIPHWRRIADHPEAYLRKVMVRESVSRWRRRRWREEPVAEPPERVVGDEAHPDRDEVRAALMALPPGQLAVIVLRYSDDLTERETAALLGISLSTVKSQARDGLARLRRRLPGLAPDRVEADVVSP